MQYCGVSKRIALGGRNRVRQLVEIKLHRVAVACLHGASNMSSQTSTACEEDISPRQDEINHILLLC